MQVALQNDHPYHDEIQNARYLKKTKCGVSSDNMRLQKDMKNAEK